MGFAVLLASMLAGGSLAIPSARSQAQPAAPPNAIPAVQPLGVLGRRSGTGGLPAVAEAVASLRMNTLYHPQPLPKQRLPLLLWGNGGCRDNGLGYAQFLREIASHGFFIVSAGYPREERALRPPPPSGVQAPTPPPATPEPGKTDVQQILAAIDWAERENGDPKSPFHQRIDTTRIGVMGTSCGGLQAISVATDPRVKASIAFNSGVLKSLPPGAGANANLVVGKGALKDLRGPIAYVNGGPTDIAYENGLDDFLRITHQPVFFAENGVGHGGTYLFDERGGEYSQVAVAWMRWQLQDDVASGRWFRGADCVLCTRPGWAVKKKNFYGETTP